MTNTQKIFILLDTSIKLFILTQQELAHQETLYNYIKHMNEQDAKCTKSYFKPWMLPSGSVVNYGENN